MFGAYMQEVDIKVL